MLRQLLITSHAVASRLTINDQSVAIAALVRKPVESRSAAACLHVDTFEIFGQQLGLPA